MNYVVNPAPTTTSLTAAANPSLFGVPNLVTASVAGYPSGTGTPTGTVQFSIDGASAGAPVVINSTGTAQFTLPPLAAGVHTVTAVYNGDVQFGASKSGSLKLNELPSPTTTTVSMSANPLTWQQPVSLTVVVAETGLGTGTPNGTVQFTVDGANAGPLFTLVGGSVTVKTTSLTVGRHAISAVYRGDANNLRSAASAVTEIVSMAPTSTTLTGSVNAAVYSQPILLTVAVAGIPSGSRVPTGTVQFRVDDAIFGWPIRLSSKGTVLYAPRRLTIGTHMITAYYSGDNSNVASASTAIIEVVSRAASAVSLSSTANPSSATMPTAITALVSPVSPASYQPHGIVQFRSDGLLVLTVPVAADGTAVWHPTYLTPGTHQITATYCGSNMFTGATSALLSQTVSSAN